MAQFLFLVRIAAAEDLWEIAMRTARMLGLLQAALLLLMMAEGCSRTPVPLTPVSGKVNYKGFGLQGGTIVFTPDASRGESGRIAFGKIHSDSSYQLFTGESEGAAAGNYRVTVISTANANLQTPGQPFAAPYSLLPDKYRDPDLSKVSCEVKPNRPNIIDFNLD